MKGNQTSRAIVLYGCSCLLLLLSACAGTPQTDDLLDNSVASRYRTTELVQVPFFAQQQYQCGPAALAMVLQSSGIEIEPDQLVPLVYIPEKKGSLQLELLTATRRLGRLPYVIKPQLRHLLDEIQAGNPVLVFQNLGLDWYPQWHYAVVVGYDLKHNEIILRSGLQQRHRVSLQLFERTWARADYWALLVLLPGEMPVNVDQQAYLDTLLGLERVQNWPVLIKSYAAAVKKWPDNLTLRMGLANSYYADKQLAIAQQHYLDIIQQ